jgi:membrane fusion protein, multidrug efflux system
VNYPVLKLSIFFIAFASGIFLFAACGKKTKTTVTTEKGGKPGGPPVIKVEGYVVKTVPLTNNLDLPGTLIANESTDINPEISGRLVYLNIREGQNVGRGALLAKIYDGDLVAQLNKLKVQVQVAEQTARRYEELLKIDGISRQEYDLARLSINNLKADMAIVRSNIMRTEIRAPYSGTLGLKNISPGAYVTPQTTITNIRQNSQLKLDFVLPEKFTGNLKMGQLVDFKTDGNDKTYHAKVTASETGVSEDNRSLRVRATVVGMDGRLLPGQFVKVSTNFDPDPNAIMIPSQAVIPQARGKQVAVYRNGIASFEDVITGVRDSANVQITNGLKVGDTIITTGLMSLKPGIKVELGEVKK